MSVEINQNGNTLQIKVGLTRIDGGNQIMEALEAADAINDQVAAVELDLDSVGYINSMGITEIINMHRKFNAAGGPSVKFRFLNVEKKVLAILELVEIQKIAEIVPQDNG